MICPPCYRRCTTPCGAYERAQEADIREREARMGRAALDHEPDLGEDPIRVLIRAILDGRDEDARWRHDDGEPSLWLDDAREGDGCDGDW